MIINADDYGLSEAVNRAILESFERGWISSTTLMATMPGFEHACQMAHERGLLHHIGAHLVMTEGPPLTDRIKRCQRLCDADGRLKLRVPRRTLRLEPDEQQALGEELTAQIRRARQFGIPLTHADSHHHAHTVWGILSVLLPIARAEQIPHVRLSRNCGQGKGLIKRAYTWLYNRRLHKSGMARTRYFGSIDDYADLAKQVRNDDIEIMVHPLYNGQGVMVDKLAERNFSEAIALVPEHQTAVSYDGQRLAR